MRIRIFVLQTNNSWYSQLSSSKSLSSDNCKPFTATPDNSANSIITAMNKHFFILIIAGLLLTCKLYGQTAEELNQQAKDFLNKGDTKSAVPLLKKAAAIGQAESQYNLAVCYQQGVEVEKNDSIANYWLIKSAEQGSVNAQFKIAYSYAVGRGCKKDMEKAFYWSLKCAAQNDPECMWNVLSCYAMGNGTKLSNDSMIAWAKRLGSLPDMEDLQMSGFITNARINLARMYRDGENVGKDIRTSYMWYLIYNESKRDHSILEQQKNITELKELEKSLSQADIEKALAEAEKQIGRKLMNLDNLYKDSLDEK